MYLPLGVQLSVDEPVFVVAGCALVLSNIWMSRAIKRTIEDNDAIERFREAIERMSEENMKATMKMSEAIERLNEENEKMSEAIERLNEEHEKMSEAIERMSTEN